MKHLAYVGVAHIHTPDFVKRLNKRKGEFSVKYVWDEEPKRAQITARKLNTKTADDLKIIMGCPVKPTSFRGGSMSLSIRIKYVG